MTEQEMMREIERLRGELAEANRSRERLREMLCVIFPVDTREFSSEEFGSMLRNAKPIDDLLRKLLPVEMQDVIHSEI